MNAQLVDICYFSSRKRRDLQSLSRDIQILIIKSLIIMFMTKLGAVLKIRGHLLPQTPPLIAIECI